MLFGLFLFLQYYQMKKRLHSITQTGSAGHLSRLDRKIMQVMIEDADILGDNVGTSSGGGIITTGKCNSIYQSRDKVVVNR